MGTTYGSILLDGGRVPGTSSKDGYEHTPRTPKVGEIWSHRKDGNTQSAFRVLGVNEETGEWYMISNRHWYERHPDSEVEISMEYDTVIRRALPEKEMWKVS